MQGENNKLFHGQKGFSLIEVMIGACIFSIGALALASMQLTGMKGNASSREQMEYVTIGMDKIETIMSLPYGHSDLTDRDGDGTNTEVNLGLFDASKDTADHFIEGPANRYIIFWNVAEDDVIAHSKTVSVIIRWDAVHMEKSISMQRVIPEII